VAIHGPDRAATFWAAVSRSVLTSVALAGSSAGAMALCRHSLVPEPGDRRPSHWRTGLGPIERVALAVHAKTAPPEWLGHVGETAQVPVVALDEGVGVVLTANAEPVVAGEGRAWILGADR
jgi:hypothetical protein